MKDNLIEELKSLAEKILNEDALNDLESSLELSRSLHEKLLILNHLQLNEASEDPQEGIDEMVQGTNEESTEEETADLSEDINFSLEQIAEPESRAEEKESVQAEFDEKKEQEPPSLSDLFVPTFEEIKDDFSQ
jgi:hypothetical protein